MSTPVKLKIKPDQKGQIQLMGHTFRPMNRPMDHAGMDLAPGSMVAIVDKNKSYELYLMPPHPDYFDYWALLELTFKGSTEDIEETVWKLDSQGEF